MPDFTYKDYKPANARVLVDYTKPPQDRVKFSYPERMSYKKALWRFGYSSFQNLINTILLLFAIYLIEFIVVFVITTSIITFIENPSLIGASHSTAPLPIGILLIFGLAVFILYGIPALLTWYYGRDKEKLASILPKMNYQTSLIGRLFRNKYIRITPKDIQGNKFILPHYSNVFLDYNAVGQMSTKLKKVQVLEYPYNYYIKKPNGKLSKKEVNHFDFMAIFEFKSKPKKGYIDVEWI
jgi:hypothetical protein